MSAVQLTFTKCLQEAEQEQMEGKKAERMEEYLKDIAQELNRIMIQYQD